jgi:hypothetical protein
MLHNKCPLIVTPPATADKLQRESREKDWIPEPAPYLIRGQARDDNNT